MSNDRRNELERLADQVMAEAKGLIESQRRLLLLSTADRVGKASARTVTVVVLIVGVALVLLFASIAGALYIGRRLGDMALGFLIMAGVFVVLSGIFLLIWRGGLRDRLHVAVINEFQSDDEDEALS